MYSLGVEQQLRQEIDGIVLDPDARNFIVRTGRRSDVPEWLGDLWAGSWTSFDLLRLAGMSQAARQDSIAARVTGFLDDPGVTSFRVGQAEAQSGDSELQEQGRVARAVIGDLVRFNSEI